MKIDFYLGTDDKLNRSILRQLAKAPGVELTAHHLGCCDRLGCTNYPTHSVYGADWGVPLVCGEHAAEYTDVVTNFGAIDRFKVVPIGESTNRTHKGMRLCSGNRESPNHEEH